MHLPITIELPEAVPMSELLIVDSLKSEQQNRKQFDELHCIRCDACADVYPRVTSEVDSEYRNRVAFYDKGKERYMLEHCHKPDFEINSFTNLELDKVTSKWTQIGVMDTLRLLNSCTVNPPLCSQLQK